MARRIAHDSEKPGRVVVTLRFYEELDDFLVPRRRKQAFAWPCPPDATIEHVIESLGVPHTEVDLILVNGESVGFSRRLQENDRVSVYPRFEAFDIASLVRLRSRPLREVRFLTDEHLGGLARWLRILGFDTRTRDDRTVEEAVRIAVLERRIVLSRSRRMLRHSAITHGCFVHATQPLRQCEEILARLHLREQARPFERGSR